MINTAILAFFVDFIGSSCVSQCGLLLQKLAHRDQEKRNLRTSVENGERQGSIYCSIRFLLGMSLMIIGTLVHLFMLPFMDLTLVGAGACLGILVAILLSVIVLGEKFVWRYDLPGLLFIAVGSISIVYNTNKKDE